MIVQMEKTPNSASKERAQKLFNKNIELEKKRQKAQQARVPSDPNAWYQIRENCEAIILEDHAFSEQHNIEFALWQLHYKRIEEFRAHFSAAAKASTRSSAANSGKIPPQPDRIAKIRGQFKAFLSEATGFYHDLIVKIRSKYGLPLGHFSDDSDTQAIMGTDTANAKSSDLKKGLVSCHRCLIYLGDLARYKGLYAEGESRVREYSAASSYYLQAASLWPSNGNPHHQLAILATYSSDELAAIYLYFRSLAAEIPFTTAKDNLVISFEKNRQSYIQLLDMTKTVGDKEVSLKEKYKGFCIQFVRLNGILFSRTSLETFASLLISVSGALRELLDSGQEEQQNFGMNAMENGVFMLRLVAVLIFTVYNVNRKTEGQSYAEILQHTVLFENACAAAFELLSLIVERCTQLRDPSSSVSLPGILVFLEWLACCPEVASCTSDHKKPTIAKMSFWKNCIALFNKLLSSQLVPVDDDGDETCFTNMSRYEEGETDNGLALWEDFELRGFLPLLPAQSILNFSRKHSVGVGGSNKENLTRIKRVISAAKALASVAMVDQQSVFFNTKTKKFGVGTQQLDSENALQTSESSSAEQKIVVSSVNSMALQDNINILFEEEDDDEEIVFKPPTIEKQMDSSGLAWIPPQMPDKRAPPVTTIPHQLAAPELRPSHNIAAQRHPIMDVNNLPWTVEQQASLADGIKSLRFAENGNLSSSEMKGVFGVSDSASLFPSQPSLGFMESGVYSNYMRAPEVMMPSRIESHVPSNFGVRPPPMFSGTSKSQTGRPVRHLGPPPGFNPIRSKHMNMPISSMVGTNGSIMVDDYSWLDGYQMPSSTSSLGPNVGPLPLGNLQFTNNGSISNGNNGSPFPGNISNGNNGSPFTVSIPNGNNSSPFPGNISNGNNGSPFPGSIPNGNNSLPFPGSIPNGNNGLPFPGSIPNGYNGLPFPGSIPNGNNGLPFPGNNGIPFSSSISNGNNSLPFPGSISNGNNGLPFPGMQASSVQFQGVSMKSLPEHQSLWNLNPNHGQSYPEQQRVVSGNQFTSQSEHYQGKPTWNGPYRV